MKKSISMLKSLSILVLGAVMAACGGGGGGGSTSDPTVPVAPPVVVPPVVTPPVVTPPTTPALTLSSTQGFWDSAPGATMRMNAVILPNGQTWVVNETAGVVTALAQVNLFLDGTTFTSTGRYFNLPNSAAQDYRFSATLPSGPGVSLLANIGVGSGAATATTLSYNKTYETPLKQSDVQARFNGLLDTIGVIWDVDATGKVAGTSTTGCTYSGTLALNSSAPSVLDATITETCAGKLQSLTGIARFNADKTILSMVYVTTPGARGGVVVLKK